MSGIEIPELSRPLALVNGEVWTGDGEAQALLVRGGRVAAVGANHEVLAADPEAVVVDVEGRRVIPGLIDSHLHFVRAGLTWNRQVDWSEVATLEEALSLIAAAAGSRPEGTWIQVVGGWGPGQFHEGRAPTRHELDLVAPNHPVYVQLLYEEALLNTPGIAAAGLAAADPPGSWVERDPQGDPTGRLGGPGAFRHCLSLAPSPTADESLQSTVSLGRLLAGLGLTGVIDPGGFGVTPETYRTVMELWRRGRLPLRLGLYVCASAPGEELESARQWVRHLHPRFGDDRLRFLGMGEILVFGCHDMEGVRPFEVDDGDAQLLGEITRLLAAQGWPLHLHAILPGTIERVLQVWEEVDGDYPVRHLRFSFAHAELITPDQLDRVARLGAGIGVQSRFVLRAADTARLVGEEAVAHAPPVRGILSRGIPLGAGTDGTAVSSYNPWRALWWLVTGHSLDGAPPRHASQRLSRAEALATYTRGSAWFSFDEARRGVLVPGALGDVAVLDRDFFSVPDEEMPAIRSVLTLLGGFPVAAEAGFEGVSAAVSG